METMTGECKFCRQVVAFNLPTGSVPTAEQLVEEATLNCNCGMSRDYRDREYKVNAAKESLDRLLPNPEENEGKKLLKDSLYAIYDGTISQVSINLCGCRAKVVKAGETIRISRVDTMTKQESV